MYKVMVVDDEIIVRKGIMTSIDWSEHGIAIAAEARNGKEALDKLQQHPVDLILTDIRMPVMSGIELARTVKSEYPDIEMVLLSGYEDFQYAKEAMSIGIRHYLLKPVIAEKLVELLSGFRDRERSKRLAKQEELIKNKLFNEHLPFMKSKLMNSLIDRQSDTGDILEKAGTLQIQLTGPAYQVIVVKADGDWLHAQRLSRKECEALAFAFLNITEETLVSRFPGFVSFGEPGTLIGLINLQPGTSIQAVCEEIRSNLLQYLKLPVSIYTGQPVRHLSAIAGCYEEAANAIRRKACSEAGKTIAAASEEAKARSKLVKEAIRYVLSHYGEPIGLREAADHVCVTPAHLSKVFKEEMGVTFMKWLNRIRVEEAKRLLADTWLKTYEIAEKVGYRDYKYFSLIFRTYAGCSPRDYRNRQDRFSGGNGNGGTV